MTTTACARQHTTLKQLGIQIVICEEAGEVMEAQSLCSFLPTVEHAISIGDPLQLRPQVNEHSLSLESDVGSEYRLDESLMERLMIPFTQNISPLPASRLNQQRRMHPQIADLMRATLYPYLQDHKSTYDRSPVSGMADRIWWLNHGELEDLPDTRSATPNSSSNAFEVEMVAGLVEYLVSSNEYDYKDITVLTPYNGQLAAFNVRFKSVCSLWLSEKDREALLLEGYLDVEDADDSQSLVEIGNMLKLATIDNFQGEESKVVILSTVRSNLQRRVGFLKTPNRINVGCSRARDGFYIIGNASLMGQVPMWQQIIDQLVSTRKIGPYFRASCPRHPKHIYRVKNPQQWYSIPECSIPCDFNFACGHTCPLKCHAHALHERQGCLEPCEKLHEPCKHPCTKRCGDLCGDCTQDILTLTLQCGHQATMTCAEEIGGMGRNDLRCQEIVGHKTLLCGHVQDVTCSTQGQVEQCHQSCQQPLECGHLCQASCHECRNKGHAQCKSQCRKELKCGHQCATKCHKGRCAPCQSPCLRCCKHGDCERLCSQTCDPCLRPCEWVCEHQGKCSTLCCLPCNRLPCSEPCKRVLSCGHLCQGLCGEGCSVECLECITGEFQTTQKIFLPCGHHFDVAFLDRALGLNKIYAIDSAGQIRGVSHITLREAFGISPKCPACGSSCRDVRRYALFNQLNDLTTNIDRAHSKFARRIHSFLGKISQARGMLNSSFDRFAQALRPGPLAARQNETIVLERGIAFTEIETAICMFRGISTPDPVRYALTLSTADMAQPFEVAVGSLVGFLGNPKVVEEYTFASALRLESLYYRCRLASLEESTKMLIPLQRLEKESQHSEILVEGLRRVNLPKIASEMDGIKGSILESQAKKLPRLEVELRLMRLASQVAMDHAGAKNMLIGANIELKEIMERCTKYPQTAGLLMPSCHKIRPFVLRTEANGHPLYSKITQDTWWSWPKHGTGKLMQCDNGHPYSGITFDRCPECGPEAEVSKMKEIDPNTTMRASDFIAAMKARNFDGASYRS